MGEKGGDNAGAAGMRKARREPVIRLLVLGQTPPPYLGQMLMIDSVVKARYADIKIYHVRMNYSRTVDEIGTVKIRKLFHLLRIILESGYRICRHRIDVIYYPPGAEKVPLLRDIATLLALRVFRRKLILVFHASGLSETVSSWTGPLRWLLRRAFFYPDAAIQKSLLNPADAAFVKAKAIYLLPNGLADQFAEYDGPKPEHAAPVILFVGIVRADKGVDVLLEAARLLQQQGRNFLIRIVGEFSSDEYRRKVLRKIEENGIRECIEFCGRKVGAEKWQLYQSADIFCFPSYYHSESFGNVLIEAMMFQLPVVATRWRGIPDIVVDGETGFLAPIKDAPAIAAKLTELLLDRRLRKRLGESGRERYLANFTKELYLERTREVVLEVAAKRSRVWNLKQPAKAPGRMRS
jgi:glycosyltransferase involved in cell wall biosynthesis